MDDNKVSAETLQRLLDQKQQVLILDVRPKAERDEWRIAESVHLDAYKRLNDGDVSVLDEVKVPGDIPVVTVCAAGRTSLIASEALRKKGIKAFSLDGGMKAWNFAWNTAEVDFASGLKVIQVRRPAKGVLSYIAGSAGQAIVIDAALDPEVYLNLARKNEWTIKYVMDTHIHADYISRTRELAAVSHAEHLLIDQAAVDFAFTPLASGESIAFGKASMEFIHTPGHTQESTTFRIADEVIFSGDTLFIDGIGRPDLKASHEEVVEKAKKLYHSLQLLLRFPANTLVLPAHTSHAIPFDHKLVGEPLSRVSEKINVMQLHERQFVDDVLKRIPPTPPNYQTIASLNKTGSHAGYEPANLEAGGNHCAIS